MNETNTGYYSGTIGNVSSGTTTLGYSGLTLQGNSTLNYSNQI